ncbi:MAG: permease-like cell division protein FtsX [Paludibacteraceae bacterium]|nr:permease-like cell division protein FtsX [Paludibacteraceae bacterium]
MLLLSAGALLTRMRENMTITAVMADDVDSTQYGRFERMLDASNAYSRYRYVSKEEALQEHIASLGEDPSAFLGYNPLAASYEIHPSDAYSEPDSLAMLAAQLESLPYISEVLYPRDLADLMSSNVHDFSFILLGIALLLLIVSMVLIVNTIRLQIYAQRFIINTMTLVGATPWVTRRPFVRRNVLIGFVAGLVALALLAAMVYYVEHKMGMWLFPLTWQNISLIAGVVLVSGMLITLFASLIATGRYIHMDNNSLYEI